ncbi:HD family phosphohydrolase [Planktothrix sp. FACHB-1355]|uniref:HD family phosphohydrolase n=1 Tax=Aerosakkonema funiforme FACHB-1375 TaxID=2949571 RepID=A0A926VFY4_9CYAN|nr:MULTISPECIES: HD family phosphohydrolase [Oscillatoriales]MBD2183175.1 HD family phosphohydrolase [Aerosakkonema funiforme FACHB-1375]MBD3560077.1 HD family phosphohydrolase [Planktothrix sp. FACHB-1355]
MKTLTTLTQQLKQWRRVAFHRYLRCRKACGIYVRSSASVLSLPPGHGRLVNGAAKTFVGTRSRPRAAARWPQPAPDLSLSSSLDLSVRSDRLSREGQSSPQQIAPPESIGNSRFLGSLLLKQLSGSLLATNLSPIRSLPSQYSLGANCRRYKSHRPPIALIVAVVSLTTSLGYRFYNQPKLDVDTIAPTTIRAPFDASVEDIKTTEAKRKAARRGLFPVLKIDPAVNEEIYQNLQKAINQIDTARQLPGPFPFTKTSVLSLGTQVYLRDCQEWEWRMVLAAANGQRLPNSQERLSLPPLPTASLSPIQQRAVGELQAYRRSTSSEELSALVEKISLVRQLYAQAVAVFSDKPTWENQTAQDTSALQLSDAAWQKMQDGLRQVAERILIQGIHPGLPTQMLERAVSMQVKAEISPAAQPLATKILMAALQPNLKEDPEQTRQQAEQAARQVKPEIIQVRKGEVIVQAGETITQADFVLLDYFGLSRRGINWQGLIGCGVLVSGAVSVFWLLERRFHPGLRRRDQILILLLTLSAPLLVSLGVPYTSLPAIGLLVGSFYGSVLGASAVGLISIGLPISMEIGWEHLLASAAGGILGSLMAGRLRSREELALLGVAVGLTEGAVYLILNLMLSAAIGSVWYSVLADAALYSLTGLAWSVVALGLSPYLEHLFDLVTPIRLAELANPNRPLLKRLAEEAPGTFQHTLFVATLAEAAAKALGCNVELVRTGTLYHDIGKLHDPQGFIENQMGGPNKHDEIDDPWKSAEIIKKHVSEGLVMARRCRLPKAIQAFIPEHQGTISIAYFYHKAEQESKQPVSEFDFRYDGPIPQSRETGIVMLADACEAALRSLKDASYEDALGTVNKILKARWQDNQLVDSGLKREEMPQIAEIFVQVWQQFHHKRIAYPKAAINPH